MQQRCVPLPVCPAARNNSDARDAIGVSPVQPMDRRGVTLIELLLVLAILALVAATAWPSLERSLADQRLRDAADTIRAEWQHARAQAMSSGVAYQFH
ncbi:MAG: prepilin-type N-terminal cleavage/methylation domain-containing protein, partial [Pirellulales bacterium]|nr:prepilin-type N-terminal cleavage/methylation domain-containing protein [Pirellulales bacterium]